MLRKLLAMLLSGAVVASATADPKDMRRREGVNLKGVVVENGRLRVGKDVSDWNFKKTRRGTLIYVASGGWRGWYLNYDHKGKDRRIGLVPEPGPGCYWQWTEGPWKKSPFPEGGSGPGGPAYTIPCRARPVNGPLKGWSLTAGESNVVLAKSPKEFQFTASVGELDTGK
jgi:hypothetical protein